jgi:hypothetical protein
MSTAQLGGIRAVRQSVFRKEPLIQPGATMLARDGSLLPRIGGMEHPDMGELGIILAGFGGERGITAVGDIVTQTQDGTDLNELWNTYQRWLGQWNSARDTLVNFLTYSTTQSFENIAQGGALADFEESTEYGEPVGYRPSTSEAPMGFPFKWFDIAGRYTWQYLANATAAQTDSFANMAMEADNRLVFLRVMRTLFGNTRGVNKEGQTVYPFYSGIAGDLPPAYKMTTFADSHNHFVTSGNTAVTAPNLEALLGLLEEHGYTGANGYNQVVMVNKAEADRIRQFRSIANGGTGLYDFIPAVNTPVFLLPTDMRVEGGRPSGSVSGLTVVGAYGNATIIQEDYIPAGYLVAIVTGGEDNLSNPIAFRQHPTTSLQGLRLAKGRNPDYPLIDSFYVRGFGCGVRHRGAGAIMQVTAGSYTVPAAYA